MKLKSIKLNLILLVLSGILIIASCFSIGFSYARYVKTQNLSVGSTVAKVVFNLDTLSQDGNTYELELNDISPGDPVQEYDLKITNGTAETFSETALRYTITLTTSGFLPLDIILYDASENLLTSLTPTTHQNTSANIEFAGGSYIQHNYSIRIDWSSLPQYNDYNYSGILDTLNISVNWEQID